MHETDFKLRLKDAGIVDNASNKFKLKLKDAGIFRQSSGILSLSHLKQWK